MISIGTANVEDTVYYMTDVDMPKVLHEVEEQYRQTFKIREILPGEAWCMMNHVRIHGCLLYTSPSPRDGLLSRMPSSA